jgi:hypothetical protein
MADGNAALEPMNLADGKWRHGTTIKEISATIANGVQGTALAKFVRAFDKTLKPEVATSAKPKAKKKTT